MIASESSDLLVPNGHAASYSHFIIATNFFAWMLCDLAIGITPDIANLIM